MARLAYSVPELGLRAARGAVARRPALLGEMIDLYRPLGLLDTDWLELAPPTPLDRLELAVLLEARGLRAESLTAFRAALAAAPPAGAAPYAWALGEALGRSGQPAEAVSVLRQALRVDAGNPELERALGAALARQGDPEALAHLRAAVTLMGRREGVLGEPPFARGDPRLRRIVAVLAADLDRTLRYRRALATYLTERALWDQALIEWRALVADEPNDAESRFGLGLSREATGAVEAAVESFRAAVELDPTSARYRRRLAERLWQSEQFFQAIIEWRALTERQPRDVQARLALGRAYERVGQATDAYREYRQVLTLEPAQADATRAVARLEGRRP
jgi:Flp pilus assembly protein TadD